MPRRILVVDDDPAVSQLVRLMLEREGYAVDSVPDGLAALERMQTSERVDLVLLDMSMPGMHGNDVLDRMRTWNCRPPVIVVSGYLSQLKPEHADLVRGKVAKPIPWNKLLASVRDALGEAS